MQLLCLSFVVMRCQPLRRALALFQNSSWSQKAKLDLKFFLAIFQEIV
ncbi:hypothetical protein VCHC46B1_3667 [Vibrio cholerae HC-46B1]|nr:hypothetical protein VCHC43B1_3646 [Vibrio cholerae HC-43B1]EKK98700.1 hypothetical protein VCHC41B1_3376 [Vibrio cholerae HC-41B1]EKL94902.1 hypothetical protein VCHC46B1_3667 [Vibrio cholerae HC-46B1]